MEPGTGAGPLIPIDTGWLIHCDDGVAAILTVGNGVTVMFFDTGVEVHPFCATLKLTVFVPGVAQLMLSGPCTLPAAGLPPPRFQVYVAAGGAAAPPV